MQEILKDLEKLDKEITIAKKDLNQAIGKTESFLIQLKEDGINSLDEAQSEISKIDLELTSLEKEINTEYENLKKVFVW